VFLDVAIDSPCIALLFLEKPRTSVLYIHYSDNTVRGGGGWVYVELEDANGAGDHGTYGKQSVGMGVQMGSRVSYLAYGGDDLFHWG